MCRPVRCKTCHKTTWAGCGRHVADVKAMVTADRWCAGHPRSTTKPNRGVLSRWLAFQGGR